ncbi:hypothetical protein AC579_159 [Pseudocercospora musae]|uniref:Uncharacterized protein n=1 Tax=Pseudocercospora musae TaxID=113226 RepID=A0A139IA47_9PEZI|nr:hypothetical protein AC579_159 [Pseudocercospora musae]
MVVERVELLDEDRPHLETFGDVSSAKIPEFHVCGQSASALVDSIKRLASAPGISKLSVVASRKNGHIVSLARLTTKWITAAHNTVRSEISSPEAQAGCAAFLSSVTANPGLTCCSISCGVLPIARTLLPHSSAITRLQRQLGDRRRCAFVDEVEYGHAQLSQSAVGAQLIVAWWYEPRVKRHFPMRPQVSCQCFLPLAPRH